MAFNNNEEISQNFFKNIKKNIDMLESSETFLEKNRALFNLTSLIELKKEEYNQNKEIGKPGYETYDIYLSSLKVFNSSKDEFKDLKKELKYFKRILFQFQYFRDILNEKETEEIKNMDIEVFKNYVKNLKETNKPPKIEKKQIKNNIDYGVSL